MYEEILKLNQS